MRRASFLAGAGALAAGCTLTANAAPVPRARIMLGDDVFLEEEWRKLRGRTVGFITNRTGVTSELVPIVHAILRTGSVQVRAIYAPEHGFSGVRPAGSSVSAYKDPETSLPVYSLYGQTRHPTNAMLDGIDVLVFDIQDVGSRAYTYVSTMAYAMQSAKEFGKEFWVLDRPNPVGGAAVEGPVMEPAFESFIGLYPIAMRHGMTVGELAMMFNGAFGIGANLHVVKMRGWDRSMIWPDTGLQWTQTSPNIPTWQTTFVYLCTGLIDNAGINNGTGFTAPFFLAGAPLINGDPIASHLNAQNLPGVWFRSTVWSPMAGFWKDKVLAGVELVVFDPAAFQPVRTAVEILCAVRDQFPHTIDVKADALDRDWGTASLREGLLAGKNAGEIVAGWTASTARFKEQREKYLLYS